MPLNHLPGCSGEEPALQWKWKPTLPPWQLCHHHSLAALDSWVKGPQGRCSGGTRAQHQPLHNMGRSSPGEQNLIGYDKLCHQYTCSTNNLVIIYYIRKGKYSPATTTTPTAVYVMLRGPPLYSEMGWTTLVKD